MQDFLLVSSTLFSLTPEVCSDALALANSDAQIVEIQARNLPFERKLTAKQEGLDKYKDDWMKRELIEERAGEIFSEYTLGPHFIDFCRGLNNRLFG